MRIIEGLCCWNILSGSFTNRFDVSFSEHETHTHITRPPASIFLIHSTFFFCVHPLFVTLCIQPNSHVFFHSLFFLYFFAFTFSSSLFLFDTIKWIWLQEEKQERKGSTKLLILFSSIKFYSSFSSSSGMSQFLCCPSFRFPFDPLVLIENSTQMLCCWDRLNQRTLIFVHAKLKYIFSFYFDIIEFDEIILNTNKTKWSCICNTIYFSTHLNTECLFKMSEPKYRKLLARTHTMRHHNASSFVRGV